MIAPLEREARYLWPHDLLRRGQELFHCERVSVSTETVEIEAIRIVDGRTADRATLHLAPGEIVRVPALPSGGDNLKAGLLLTR